MELLKQSRRDVLFVKNNDCNLKQAPSGATCLLFAKTHPFTNKFIENENNSPKMPHLL